LYKQKDTFTEIPRILTFGSDLNWDIELGGLKHRNPEGNADQELPALFRQVVKIQQKLRNANASKFSGYKLVNKK
jgi:hypothetical protein